MKRLILYEGPVGTMSGYGKHSKDLVKCLIEQCGDESDILIVPTNWGNTPHTNLDPIKDYDITSRLLTNPQLQRQPDLYIQVTIPTEFKRVGKKNIGITAGIETDTVSPQFIEGANLMDLIIVPSHHAKLGFLNSKWSKQDDRTGQQIGNVEMKAKIEVLFEGVDFDIFKKLDKDENIINLNEIDNIPEDFLFLYVGHWLNGKLGEDRKDVGMLIKTFFETFKDKEIQPALVLKTSSAGTSMMDRYNILDKIKAIALTISGKLPNVYLLHGELTDVEMNALYNHKKIKTMVSFTHGEGWSRCFSEFIPSGKPLIVSNWSGHLDFLIPNGCVLLNGTIKPIGASAIWQNILIKESNWFYVDYEYAKNKMIQMFEHYSRYTAMAKEQVKYIKKFSLKDMGIKFKKIIDSTLSGVPMEPNFIDPSTLNLPTPEEIMPVLETEKITLPKLTLT